MKTKTLRLLKFQLSTGEVAGRAVFKNQHGRTIFIVVICSELGYRITECCYIDRNQHEKGSNHFSCIPKKFAFNTEYINEELLLKQIAEQLNKQFNSVVLEYEDNSLKLSSYSFICEQKQAMPFKHRFLILVAYSDFLSPDGIPIVLKTRIKTNTHRSVFLQIKYHDDANGVIEECYYCDRKYCRNEIKVTPHQLTSVFFKYNKESILELVNRELVCSFTAIIIASKNDIDVEQSLTPICGAL